MMRIIRTVLELIESDGSECFGSTNPVIRAMREHGSIKYMKQNGMSEFLPVSGVRFRDLG
jgi:hypothetical protein